MIRPGALVLGVVLAAPSLWRAIVEQTIDPLTAGWHLIAALVLAQIGWALVAALVHSYIKEEPQEPQERISLAALEQQLRAANGSGTAMVDEDSATGSSAATDPDLSATPTNDLIANMEAELAAAATAESETGQSDSGNSTELDKPNGKAQIGQGNKSNKAPQRMGKPAKTAA